MPVSTEGELSEAARKAGELLQNIQDYLGDRKSEEGRVRFPRGFIKGADDYRSKLPSYVKSPLRDNIAYALMMTDVLRWLATRTDITATALDMIIKQGIAIVASVAEALSIRKGHVGLGKSKSLRDRISSYNETGVISDNLWRDLVWLWKKRQGVHLYDLEHSEYHIGYTRDEYNRARRTLSKFIDALLLAERQGD